MKLFERANIRTRRGQYLVRDEKIKREGSQPFVHKIDTLTAGSITAVDVGTTWPASRKFEPLDFIELTNNDSVDLELIINQGDSWLIPAGIIKTIKGRPIWRYSVKNLDAAVDVTANKVRATLKKEPLTIDQWARGQRV